MSKRVYAAALAGPPKSAKLADFTLTEVDRSTETYEASEFGGFPDYMRRKKLKLQNQDAQMRATADPALPKVFAGMVLHINGYTKPGRLDLWQLIVSHGGVYKQYLENKSDVTHIICSNLTKKKEQEFQKYRVVRPEWITDSIAASRALPWSDYSTIVPEGQQRQLAHSSQSGDRLSLADKRSVDEGNSYKRKSARASGATDAMESPERPMVAHEQRDRDRKDSGTDVKTATHPDFIRDYYSKSRLHHLSAWKADLRLKIHNLQPPYCARDQKVVMHIDFDCFFAAVSSRKRPDLAGAATAVTHGGSNSGEIASCNYEARRYGVKNGMWMKEAILLCPKLISLPYDFTAYEDASNKFFENLLQLNAVRIEAVSIDEALVDITNLVPPHRRIDEVVEPIETFVGALRAKILHQTQCAVSAGVGSSVLQAKLATKLAKPAGQLTLTTSNLNQSIHELGVRDLPGVGHATASKISDATGAESLLQLHQVPETTLQTMLGINLGRTIYRACRGQDDYIVGNINDRKLVSIEINWGIRFTTSDEVHDFLGRVAAELTLKLNAAGFANARHLLLKVMRRAQDASIDPPKFLGHGKCDKVNAGREIPSTNDAGCIAQHAISLMDHMKIPPSELRGIGVALTKLGTATETQRTMSMFVTDPRAIHQSLRPSVRRSALHVDAGNSLTKQMDKPSADAAPNTPLPGAGSSVIRKTPTAQISGPHLSQDIDPEVLSELPPHIRNEILRQQGSSAANASSSLISRRGMMSAESKEAVEQASEGMTTSIDLPSMGGTELASLGLSDLDGAKDYLSRWVGAGSLQGPEADDAHDFGQYLKYLINEQDFERVESLMRWFYLLVASTDNPFWREQQDQLFASVRASLQDAGMPNFKAAYETC